MAKTPDGNRYQRLIQKIFFDHWKRGEKSFEWHRAELETAAEELGIVLPKNIGDALYAIRYRTPMPQKVVETSPPGLEWIIEGAGKSKYRFCLTSANRLIPRADFAAIKIPDATPEIITRYALSDEQALLAKVRYNRLIDIFLGLTTYSLQNHLRTAVKGIGQIEIDEIYVGVNRNGAQYVIPVQAKGGSDQLSVVQTKQDVSCCHARFPNLICRAVSAQFMANDVIALFELMIADEGVKIVEERHYQLVDADSIKDADLTSYRQRT